MYQTAINAWAAFVGNDNFAWAVVSFFSVLFIAIIFTIHAHQGKYE